VVKEKGKEKEKKGQQAGMFGGTGNLQLV